jgi:CubicO group peptidase (beta-lactamase class C family)
MTADHLDQDRLTTLAVGIDAPDVVIACSRRGERVFATGGSSGRDASVLMNLRYEIGSASKTFTGLLLAHLAHRGALGLDDPVAQHLPVPRGHARRDSITLFHLVTHTSGLPRLPRDLYRHGLPRWLVNPYAGYSTAKLVDAFARSRPGHRPGTHWRYSNFGVALLGPAIAGAAGSPFEQLLAEEILNPLGLTDTALTPQGPDRDVTGHGYRPGRTVPAFDAGAFTAAGAVRATPGDLLTYLEAHVRPDRVTPLEDALSEAQKPAVRRGFRRRNSHTLTWFHHPYDESPILFHSGATPGQEAFLGFRPATQTAVVALSTRRYRPGSPLQQLAYELLT